MATAEVELPPARYEYGGDEFVFVEISDEMSLEANFKAMMVTSALAEERLDGVVDICPSNASYMIRLDPDVLDPRALVEELRRMDEQAAELPDDFVLQTRIVDVPVLYNDPWTHEALMRFRDRHQDPDGTDLDYAARINGFDTVEAFVEHHSGAP